ncbi:hypothetical protein VTK56DRAFT_4784 [Thermocarpiscus australiensis]
MAGLIPLMLASSTRTSCTAPSPSPPRRQSTSSSMTQAQAARPRLSKRFSIPAPAPLPMLPYTPADWKRTIAEIKKEYFSKRYRACSARCIEILNGIRHTSQVEPVYLIYLHFYAATSIEICARPLPFSSALRTSLLQQARTHFDQAASLIDAAQESVIKKVRSCSVTSSRSSSCHSPSGSISSRAWTPDTRLTSPTDSVYSYEDFSAKSQFSSKRVKKVSFPLPREEAPRIAEPIIRPDSPTLGFDDRYFPACGPQQEFPDSDEPSKFQEIELPLQTTTDGESNSASEQAASEAQQQEDDDEKVYQAARSADRCCEHLSSLRAQLARHSASLDELLAARPDPASTAETLRSADRTGCSPEVVRALERKARIDRLRKNGWQRKRFDARRYEELCEAVLSELE